MTEADVVTVAVGCIVMVLYVSGLAVHTLRQKSL
jgi:uncharacterized iron-regulated membrane protein